MEITILKIYEEKNTLRVEVETPYGIDNIGLSLDKKYLDPATGNPRWQSTVQKLLEKKYANKQADNVIPRTDEFKEWHGHKCKLDCLGKEAVPKKK